MPTSRRRFLMGATAAAAAALPIAAQRTKLKVHISVDMEGIAGVVSDDQLSPGAFEYERFRNFMTRETVAAVNGAKDAGATEILIADSHGNGENLLIDQFPNDVRVIRSWPRKLGMMAGVDATFDAAIFIGYHASTTNTRGVRAHTFSSAKLTRVALNGTAVTEGAFNAAIAGHFNVPVVLVAGDDAAIAEVRSVVGNIEGAETKRALSFHSADTITPDASCLMIREKVRAAVARRADFKPYRVSSPVTLEVSFKHYRPVELLGYLRGVERIDSHTIRYRGQDMLDISDFSMFLTHYDPNLEP
ncbi:MAG TPA: M55 family metallopeptidase [Bryobacteraceae bacterium]|nr:M55 family metallopeptidase [Bryobacteraceae bacterium]